MKNSSKEPVPAIIMLQVCSIKFIQSLASIQCRQSPLRHLRCLAQVQVLS